MIAFAKAELLDNRVRVKTVGRRHSAARKGRARDRTPRQRNLIDCRTVNAWRREGIWPRKTELFVTGHAEGVHQGAADILD